MSAIDFARRKVEQSRDAVVEQVEHFGQFNELEQMSRLKVSSRLVHVMIQTVVGVDEPGEKVGKIEEHKASRYGQKHFSDAQILIQIVFGFAKRSKRKNRTHIIIISVIGAIVVIALTRERVNSS